jgi:ABC-type anion transport system duplicated permease subunit
MAQSLQTYVATGTELWKRRRRGGLGDRHVIATFHSQDGGTPKSLHRSQNAWIISSLKCSGEGQRTALLWLGHKGTENSSHFASWTTTALFPIIVLLLARVGGGLAVGSIVLMLLGTQWYILFNVIAGAMALPTDLKEVCNVFQFGRWERWRELLLPGIFPYLITGFVTASGGAWNASILAEYFHLKGQTFSTTGLGAVVSNAADRGNYPVLLVATMLMALIVLVINRLVWRRLYTLASTKFRLEA